MSTFDDNGYVLVKDKDGNLKYYKDGKFFSVEEITKAKTASAVAEQKKVELKPIKTFAKVETEDKKSLAPVFRPVAVASSTSVKTASLKVESSTNSKPIELDDLQKDDDLLARRNEDQTVISQRVDEVIVKLKIKFSDPEVEKRFRNILTTFFRGVRTVKELSYMLELPRANGGLELPREKVGLIVSVLEHTAREINHERRDIAAKAKEKVVVRAVADFEHQLMPPPPVIIPTKTAAPKLEPAKPVVDSKPELKEELKLEIPTPLPKKSIAPVISKPIVERPKPIITPMPPTKPRLENMQLAHRLVGPVEELHIMTLKDWRDLGNDAAQISAKILEKFQVLKAQSLKSLIQGREVWKKSPIFQLYITMTFQALKEKRSLEQVIESRQVENKDVLTRSEYEAFAELNRQIGED